jgi:DNA helicase II / ATP-dependent DNA helicase PcrA
MRLVADLHVHSRYSRATSRQADLAGFHRWARIKGIDIVGTGDFTHPRWIAELSAQLVEKDGLYVLSDPPCESGLEGASPADRIVRFLPTAEISSIYKKHGCVRKVHSLIGVPTLEDARRLGVKLAAIGNIASDGRPILGLDPKDLLSMVLEVNEDGFLIPAHIWTPWFSLFGSKSGFDRIEDCFEELTPRIFALETGLSSDPPMNWRWSALDRFRLVSNSDAHSPANLGREATLLDADPSWHGVTGALRTGVGFLGTCEFFPEEGKYHFDGHRSCGVCMDPGQTAACGGACPVCGKPLTVGVLSRVLGLADRGSPLQPRPSEGYRSLIPLPELLSEIAGVGPGSRTVMERYARLVSAYGSEYGMLLDADVGEISRHHGGLLGEAVRRMREGRITPRPGYDGEFGVIRVFDDAERDGLRGQDRLFRGGGDGDASAATGRDARRAPAGGPAAAAVAGAAAIRPTDRTGGNGAADLDDDQRAIAESPAPRILVSAGPGSGKTRLLVSWIARVAETCVPAPGRILALTFTNRAADELRERLAARMGNRAADVTASTFHSLCWTLLREGDPGLLTLLSASGRRALLGTLNPDMRPAARDALSDAMERVWDGMEEPDEDLRGAMSRYEEELRRTGSADISSLVVRCTSLLASDPGMLGRVTGRYRAVAVDELQDIDPPQFALLRLLSAPAAAVLCIGDPDQAIYGFRGSDRALFFKFRDETGAVAHGLRRNYRSSAAIVGAADGLMAGDGRTGGSRPAARAMRPEGERIRTARVKDPDEEARFIASAIRDLVGGVDAVSVDAARSGKPGAYAFSDIAILFRTRAVRDALLPGLVAAGLPVRLRSDAPLTEEEPFRSLLAALRLVANPDDAVSLAILRAHQAACGPEGGDAVGRMLAEQPELARIAAADGIAAVMDGVMDRIVALDRSLPEVSLGEEALRASAARFGRDLPGFLAHASLCVRESEWTRPVQNISLLTFHAAKGLEFPVVFIAGAEEGIMPLARYSRADAPGHAARGDDPAEERRLFYVAMTRARDLLCITHCRGRRVYGALRECAPSPFLADIPAHLRADETPRVRGRQLTLF